MRDLGYNFHVWEKNPETGKLFKYVAFFGSAEGALEWCRKQPRGKEGYRITNFGPVDLAKQHTDKVARDKEAAKRRKRVLANNAKNDQLRKEAREAAFAKQRERIAAEKERAAKANKQAAERLKEREAIGRGAQSIIDQHKADEQADLDAGINR